MNSRKNDVRNNVIEKLVEIHEKGIKLTKENVDEDIYNTAVQAFGTWMAVKRAVYKNLEIKTNPKKNLQYLLIKKVEDLEAATKVPVLKNSELNQEFIDYVKEKDTFLEELLMSTFETWDAFLEAYEELASPAPLYSDKELAEGISSAIVNDNIIQENIFARKYTDIYNAIVRDYGSLKEGLVHLLMDVSNAKK